MASELFNNSPPSNEFAHIIPNQEGEVEKLTERIRDLEYKERMNESSLKSLNAEYQKAVNQLKHFDPLVRRSRKYPMKFATATYPRYYRLANRKHAKAIRRGTSH